MIGSAAWGLWFWTLYFLFQHWILLCLILLACYKKLPTFLLEKGLLPCLSISLLHQWWTLRNILWYFHAYFSKKVIWSKLLYDFEVFSLNVDLFQKKQLLGCKPLKYNINTEPWETKPFFKSSFKSIVLKVMKYLQFSCHLDYKWCPGIIRTMASKYIGSSDPMPSAYDVH